MVYFRDLFGQSNESDISDVHQHEPDYKKFSYDLLVLPYVCTT